MELKLYFRKHSFERDNFKLDSHDRNVQTFKNKPTCTRRAWCPTLGPFRWCSLEASTQLCRRSRLDWCHQPVTGRSSGPGQNQRSTAMGHQIRTYTLTRRKPVGFLTTSPCWLWQVAKLILFALCGMMRVMRPCPSLQEGEAFHVSAQERTPTHHTQTHREI